MQIIYLPRTSLFDKRRGRLFLNANERAWAKVILAKKASSSCYGFSRECRGGGSKLSNIRSFIILLLGKGLTSFNKNNCANFAGEKMTMKLSGVSLFWVDAKKP